jgi:hypothetical protein
MQQKTLNIRLLASTTLHDDNHSIIWHLILITHQELILPRSIHAHPSIEIF